MAMRPILPAYVETDPVAMNQMTVGLPDVIVLGTSASDEELEIHVMLDSPRAACASYGVPARFKGWRAVVLRDRPTWSSSLAKTVAGASSTNSFDSRVLLISLRSTSLRARGWGVARTTDS
jgi:hypothetical protein